MLVRWAVRNESRLTQLSLVYSDVKVQMGKDKEISFVPDSGDGMVSSS